MSSYMTNASVIDGEGTPEQAAEFLLNLTTYITVNGYHLVDFDGNVTTWGDWCALLFCCVWWCWRDCCCSHG